MKVLWPEVCKKEAQKTSGAEDKVHGRQVQTLATGVGSREGDLCSVCRLELS